MDFFKTEMLRFDVIQAVLKEREEQIKKGWTCEYDDGLKENELVDAGVMFAYAATGCPEAAELVKPSDTDKAPVLNEKDPERTKRALLIKSIAMLTAEVERMDRYEAEYQEQVTLATQNFKERVDWIVGVLPAVPDATRLAMLLDIAHKLEPFLQQAASALCSLGAAGAEKQNASYFHGVAREQSDV